MAFPRDGGLHWIGLGSKYYRLTKVLAEAAAKAGAGIGRSWANMQGGVSKLFHFFFRLR